MAHMHVDSQLAMTDEFGQRSSDVIVRTPLVRSTAPQQRTSAIPRRPSDQQFYLHPSGRRSDSESIIVLPKTNNETFPSLPCRVWSERKEANHPLFVGRTFDSVHQRRLRRTGLQPRLTFYVLLYGGLFDLKRRL